MIIGAGGHGRVVADCAEQTGAYTKIEFLDDCFDERKNNAHWPIIGKSEQFKNYLASHDFIVAFGSNELRMSWLEKLQTNNADITTLIHPSATISPHAKIGKGTVIFAGAVVNIGSEIGNGVIINTSANIDHDNVIENGVHISPNASLAGQVTVGEKTWIGIGATVIQCQAITANCQIGAGAVVINNIEVPGIYVGIPAKQKS